MSLRQRAEVQEVLRRGGVIPARATPTSLLPLLQNRWEECDLLGYRATGSDQIPDESVMNIEDALIFGAIAQLVALRQNSPNIRTQAKSIRQYLKNNVALRRPESVVP